MTSLSSSFFPFLIPFLLTQTLVVHKGSSSSGLLDIQKYAEIVNIKLDIHHL